MDLREYLFKNRMSQAKLAEKVGITRRYMSVISCGKFRPSIRLAKDIQAATDGMVTIEELRALPNPTGD